MKPVNQTGFILPNQVVGRMDVSRLIKETRQIDSFLEQAATRKPGTPVTPPKSSPLFNDFVVANKLNVLHRSDRVRILSFLIAIKAMAPRIRISFSTEPAPTFVQEIVVWLREEVHPLVLLQVGLQPTIGLGCVVYGTNESFDFSLREHFTQQQPMLIRRLRFGSGHIASSRVARSGRPAPIVSILTRAAVPAQLSTEAELTRAVESGLVALESLDAAPQAQHGQRHTSADTRGK